jgi:2-octaprenyl-6-methoxyphenol hydroxylase
MSADAILDCDIAICGAGPVGLALAAMLTQAGLPSQRMLLIDARNAGAANADPRSLALSHGSRQLLEGIQAWPENLTAIHDIHVSRQGRFGRALLSREDYDLPALGHVARYGVLTAALEAAVQARGIPTIRPARVASTAEFADHVALTLSDGRTINAGIAIQAEGGVFGEPAVGSMQRDYLQTALACRVKSDAPLAHRAFERFTDEGPLALLPQDEGYALVWCTSPASAERLLGLSDDAFLAALQSAFGKRLGKFSATGPRASNTNQREAARMVAVGNAAQTLHPVAGQGLNLGLRDAAVLARLLAEDPAPSALHRFATARQADRGLTLHLTDVLARLFTLRSGAVQSLLGAGLGLMDVVAPAKRMLAEQMIYGRR